MIVIDCRSLQDDSKFRGIGTVIRNLIEFIPNKDRYCLLIEKGKGDIESYGMTVLAFKAPVNKKKYGQELAAFLLSHQIRQCHFMAQYNIPDSFDFPYSVTVHDLFNEHLLSNEKKYQQQLAPLLSKLAAANHIIAISEYTKGTVKEQLPNARVSVIYNGFNSSIARDAETEINLSVELNIQDPFILYMGNFEKRKNLIGALRGFLEFSERYPQYQLVACTGHQPLILPPDILWLRLKHRKKIKILSYIKSVQLANLYKKATALLFASHAEGFGLPVLEAMAVDTPAVISNTTSLPEVGKDAAVYVDPKDPKDIGRGLELLISDSNYRQLVSSNMTKVLNDFDIKTQAAQYDQAFNLA
ncbi:hypothetical protein DID73_01405 [Candidatus Marinamargulisbacteria bacterium SCGC AG-343-K17]|nr:hypothetical protein DID73_01405 [Candidatus Marinamargulisbacteria bacterium SCGC AG-343-K17]